MSFKFNSIHRTVQDALSQGRALSRKEILGLREKNRRAITAYKATFWAAIIVFNVLVWVPLPFELNLIARLAIGATCLVVAFIPPIFGIKQHQRRLERLRDSPRGPKKGKAGAEGKTYIENVRKENRTFIIAEVEVLEGQEIASDATES